MAANGTLRIRTATWRALGVAALYGCIGALWIGYSDQFVAGLDLDVATLTRVQQYKGWGYVLVTAVLLFAGLRYLFGRIDRSHERLVRQHARLMALNRLYRMVRSVKGALLRVREADVVLQETCRVAVIEGSYRLAWVGLRSPDGQYLRARAHAGMGEALFRDLAIRIDVAGDSPAMQALASGHCVIHAGEFDPALAQGSRRAARLGYRSIIALPLRLNGDTIGVLVIYGDRADSFGDPEERGLLVEIADNLALGMSYLDRGRALDELSHYDTVTGLANRQLFEQRLTQALLRAEQRSTKVGVVIVDIDDFRSINHAGGRETGDAALRATAQILSGVIRPGDTVARMGNDEFAVLLVDLPASELVSTPVGRIADALPQRLEPTGHKLFLSASMGVALYPDDGSNADELITRAELALRSPPRVQRSTISYFGSELNERASRRRQLELELRSSIGSSEFALVWQPILDLEREVADGSEALLRWHHPELGPISPASFIPLAEQTGLIVSLGEDVLRRACAQAAEWSGPGGSRLQVGVNVAVQQLHHPHFPELVEEVLAEHGNAHWQLALELTESEVMLDPEEMIRTCRQLRALGCAIHVDDFGTGHSALSYLTRLPIDALKIDRSFVAEAEHDEGVRAVIEAVVTLARRLQLTVIAEGVETRGQLRVVRELGCHRVQGFLFGRPMPAAEVFRDFLAETRRFA